MKLEELHMYLHKFVSDEQIQSNIELAYRQNEGKLTPENIVMACEQADKANDPETVVEAMMALRMCEIYGEALFENWKRFLGDKRTTGVIAGFVYDYLWETLETDPRGVKAPLASALMDNLDKGVDFVNSRDLVPIVRRVLEK